MARNSRVLVQQLLDSGNRNPCAALLRKLPGCNFIEPVTLTSIPTTPSSPPPQIASAYRPFSSSVHASYLHYLPHRRHASTIPFETLYGHSGDLTFDRIRDESLTAVCCFYGMLDLSCRYAPPIIQRLVDQFPHVKAFHFILSDDEDLSYDVTMRALKISSLPMFHFYQNGEKVEELAGDYIVRFKRVLDKLYKKEHGGTSDCLGGLILWLEPGSELW